MKIFLTLLILLCPTFVNAKDLIPIRWIFDLGPMGNHSWVIRGIKEGTFEKHGFDVDAIGIGPGGYKVGMALYAGKADIGYHDFSALVVVNGRQETAGIKAIFVVDDKSQDGVFFRANSGIETLEDLNGKRVGAGPTAMTRQLLKMVTDSEPDYVNLSSSLLVPALVKNEVVAINGYTSTIIFNLEKVGIADWDWLPLSSSLGYPVGRVISASNQWLEKYPGAEVALRSAIAEALNAHLTDPETSINSLTNTLTSTEEGLQTEIRRAEYNINDLILTESVQKNGLNNPTLLPPRLEKYIDILTETLELPYKHNYNQYFQLN
jgi:NitT/TauT family transport system substrate-binding protein